ncbi:MAG TPA: protein translocase subunit SecD [Marmoricola sp.]|nr:protein translocase subunit SecD [Marmoricola sp.]
MASRISRPARTLLVFFIAIAVLYGLAALGGTWKPALGLDLEGGTRITLTAVGDGITPEKMNQARQIIDARVNGNGVSEAEVTVQSNKNIVVEIPGKNRQNLVDSVKRTAQLRFRLVAGQPMGPVGQQPTTTPSPNPSASPSGKASPSGTASPSGSASPKATSSSTSGSNRPAPAFDLRAADPTPTPTPTPTTQTPGGDQTPAGPAGTDAVVRQALAFAQNPPQEWVARQAAYRCPDKGEAAGVEDDPDKPLVTCDEDGNRFLLTRAVIEGTSLDSASYGTPPQGVGWVVQLDLEGGEPTQRFGNISKALYANGGQFAIVLDGQVISYAGFQEPILDGNAQISGDFTEGEAKSLANSLKFGALPIKFSNPPTVETIGATLAGDQLSAGILAGIVGLLIVMLYCLLYYRGLGFVVIASLLVAAAITYATVLVLAKAANFTLTLPGIAGLIVAVGITADSFIVYFERIRDEMRDGKSMRVAVEAGWVRARNTCLAADAVSFLAAVVLYIFAIGVVRGFAFALGISTLIDVAVFFWFTKPMISLLARRRFFNSGSKYSGLSAETLGIDEITADRRLAGGRA